MQQLGEVAPGAASALHSTLEGWDPRLSAERWGLPFAFHTYTPRDQARSPLPLLGRGDILDTLVLSETVDVHLPTRLRR